MKLVLREFSGKIVKRYQYVVVDPNTRNDGKPTNDKDEIGWEKYKLDYLNLFRRDLQAIGYDMSTLKDACGR